MALIMGMVEHMALHIRVFGINSFKTGAEIFRYGNRISRLFHFIHSGLLGLHNHTAVIQFIAVKAACCLTALI